MDNKVQNQRNSDEIDLFELFNRMGAGLKNLFWKTLDVLKSLTILILRKSAWIIVFAGVSYFVGHFYYLKTDKYYTTEIVLRSNSVNNNIILDMINSGAYQATSPKNIEKIRSIVAYYGIDYNGDQVADRVDYSNSFDPQDTKQKRVTDVFYLRINVTDAGIIKDIVNDICKYISNNKYISDNNNIRLQETQLLIEKYKSEIQRLDSLEKFQYFQTSKQQKSGNNQTIILNEKETKLYHNEKIALYKTKQTLERDLIINPSPITIIQDSSQISIVESSNKALLKKYVYLFAFLGFLIALIWQHRVKIWHSIKERK